MIRALVRLVALVLLAALVWAAVLWRGPEPLTGGSADRPLNQALPSEGPLRITIFGTSLSDAGRYDWPNRLANRLSACLGRPVEMARITRPGANGDWAAEQGAAVAATRPDLVLVEFAINDADILDGLSLAQARARTAGIVADLRAGPSAPQVVLMTMSPAQGLRGVLRPRLSAHYAALRQDAAALETGLVDLEQRWRALPRGARGLGADGLHPDRDVAREVIVPVIAGYLAGGGC